MLILLNLVLSFFVLLFPHGERRFIFKNDFPWIQQLAFDDTSAHDFKLQFVSAHDLFYVDSAEQKSQENFDEMVSNVQISDTNDTKADVEIVEISEDKSIQYPDKTKHALSDFFEALLQLENGSNQIFRILHYGDSQLEGDRISDYVRSKMQNRFGGNGPGIVLPIDVSKSRVSIRQSESGDWNKYAIYTTNRLEDGNYGIGGSTYRFSGKFLKVVGTDTVIKRAYDSMIVKTKNIPLKEPIIDSVSGDTIRFKTEKYKVPFDSSKFHYDTTYRKRYEKTGEGNSWLKFNCATQSYPRVRTFNQVKLLYNSKDTCRLIATIDGVEKSMVLPASSTTQLITIHNGNVSEGVTLNFKGLSPNIFGVLLDGETGIAVDNFPMRGSSGTGYSMINSGVYARQLELTNTKLIIMEYGINVVPNPQKNYDYYQKLFDAQLKAIRKAKPDVDILIIGPSDMSRKVGAEHKSYPNITLIRDAMKKAAFDNGCAFWDLYAAMGGQNSMVEWVNAKPPLASKDYTHFSSKGAAYVGEMLYDALMSEYHYWKLGKSQNP